MDFRISSLLSRLENRPHSTTVTNPYRLPHRSDNLKAYLQAMLDRSSRRILVVGEALGYRGGLGTGIPVSSCALLRQGSHPFLRKLGKELNIQGEVGEATASIVWNYLQNRRTLPLFWNAFPFHPHLEGRKDSNRAPRSAEVAEGLEYLGMLAELYQPQRIAGLGLKGSRAAELAFPGRTITRIRHPSYGGKEQFIRGMDRLLNSH